MIDIYEGISDRYRGRYVFWVKLSELVPRKIQPFNNELLRDILKCGLHCPLSIEYNYVGNIITGNQRYVILKMLNVEKVPVVFKRNEFNKFKKQFIKYKKMKYGKQRIKCFR